MQLVTFRGAIESLRKVLLIFSLCIFKNIVYEFIVAEIFTIHEIFHITDKHKMKANWFSIAFSSQTASNILIKSENEYVQE